MQKEKMLKMGFEPLTITLGPGDIPSELLGMATCQAETIFTYFYIEVLTFHGSR